MTALTVDCRCHGDVTSKRSGGRRFLLHRCLFVAVVTMTSQKDPVERHPACLMERQWQPGCVLAVAPASDDALRDDDDDAQVMSCP